MEEKIPKYNRAKAIEVEDAIKALQDGEFAEIQQEADDLIKDFKAFQARTDLLNVVSRMINIHEKYGSKSDPKALPAGKTERSNPDDEDYFGIPIPY